MTRSRCPTSGPWSRRAARASPSWTRDAGDPDAILGAVAAELDLAAPTCLIMGFLLHFYSPARRARWCAGTPPRLPPAATRHLECPRRRRGRGPLVRHLQSGVAQGHNYPVAEFATLFDGMELVPPGVVDGRQWHPGWSDLPAVPFRDGQAISGVARIR